MFLWEKLLCPVLKGVPHCSTEGKADREEENGNYEKESEPENKVTCIVLRSILRYVVRSS